MMRVLSNKKTWRRALSFAVALTFVLCLLPVTAKAATVSNIRVMSGRPSGGLLPVGEGDAAIVNLVNSNLTITASSGQSGLAVPANATAYLLIMPGYTLTVTGGAGSNATGGGAGIEIPETSKLVLLGGGTVIARGGSAGFAGDGTSGGDGGIYYDDAAMTYGHYIGAYNGAGGAGAGIGGKGGNGGARARNVLGCSGSFSNNENRGGVAGFVNIAGNAGANGGSMGVLEVLGEVKVQATGGSVYTLRGDGGTGGRGMIAYPNNSSFNAAAGGGAGGGGGGMGGYGAAIGSGGPGGGSGGPGGGGGFTRTSGSTAVVLLAGGGGGGASVTGYGGYAGTYTRSISSNLGPKNVSYQFQSGSSTATAGTTVPGIGGGYAVSGSGLAAGGGMGGAAGAYGAQGTVKKTAGASISGRAADEIITASSELSLTMSFQNTPSFTGATGAEAVSSPPSPAVLSYGDPLPLTVTVPTCEGFKFLGYFGDLQTVDTATQVYDHRGVRKKEINNQTGTKTIYAWWSQSSFKVTFNVQGGDAGGVEVGETDFAITGNGTPYVITQEAAENAAYCLLPNTTITPPTRAHYRFDGYYSEAAGLGIQYYNADGTPVETTQVTANTTVFAKWTQTEKPVQINQSGGTGAFRAWVNVDGAMLAGGIAPSDLPTRTGYAFNGYWTEATGGEQCYDANGSPTSYRLANVADSVPVFYAQWTPMTYTITYHLGDGGSMTGQQPTAHVYNDTVSIPDPTNSVDGKVFSGWQINGGAGRVFNLTIPADDPAWADHVTLTATWTDQAAAEVEVTIVTGNVANKDAVEEELKTAFDNLVTDDTKGITVDDMSGNDHTVTLKLTVSPYTAPAAGQGDSIADDVLIGGTAQGTPLQYYDLTVTKTLTPVSGGAATTTTLTELPVPIKIVIDLTGELANQPSYAVYRVHKEDGATLGAAERLPLGTRNGEYYEVSGNTLTISTRKFSTYAVTATTASLANTNEDGQFVSSDISGASQGVDVQGRVIVNTAASVYKIDLSWGDMKFTYSTANEWSHETHMFSEGSFNGWVPEDLNGVNNKLTVLNHSNGRVRVNFVVVSGVTGVDMKLHVANEDTAEEVPNLILSAAADGAANAELAPGIAYLRLTGAPEQVWLANAANLTYTKAGVITATVEALSN